MFSTPRLPFRARRRSMARLGSLRRLRAVALVVQRSSQMMQRQPDAPAGVYVLADHLDAALASCEDLRKADRVPVDLNRNFQLELAIILHVLQARHRLKEFAFPDEGLAEEAMRFLGGTAALEDKV